MPHNSWWMFLVVLVLGACGGGADDPPTEVCEAFGDGWERCYPEGGTPSAGAINRVGPASCDPSSAPAACSGAMGTLPNECDVDGDCATGSCLQVGLCGQCDCATTCTADAECPAGTICACAERYVGGSTRCRPAQCAGPEDCGGQACGMSTDGCGWEYEGTFCRSDKDSCRYDSDCGPGNTQCAWVEDRWACRTMATCDC